MANVLDAVLNQYKQNKSGGQRKEVDLTKYFSAVLQKNESAGKKRFRILPPTPGKSPFEEAHFHEIQVDGQWRKVYCPHKNDGEACPFCEAERELMATGKKEDAEIAKAYRSRKFYVVKGIDRMKPDEGVKFWRFKHNYKAEGIIDKIIPLFEEEGDITDPKAGRDLLISMGKDDKGYTKITSILVKDKEPLGEPNQVKEWMEDELTWRDVYSKKPYDYMEILLAGKTPTWDSVKGKFVPQGEQTQANVSANSEMYDDEEIIVKPKSKMVQVDEDDDESPF